jgi:hypothetical protein
VVLRIQSYPNLNLDIEILSGKFANFFSSFTLNFYSKSHIVKNDLGKISHFSTSSFDGTLILWNIEDLLNTQKFKDLVI